MKICPNCRYLGLNNNSYSRHFKLCSLNYKYIDTIVEEYTILYYSIRRISKKYKLSAPFVKNYLTFKNVTIRTKEEVIIAKTITSDKKIYTQEERLNMSVKRKQFLKENPEKHNWKTNDKFKSMPCEHLKNVLKNRNILFIEEYAINTYSLDIAFPQLKIAIEVNGNQHYSIKGILKEYYQKRHDYIESLGWYIYELHYKIPYSDKINEIIDNILNKSSEIYDFNYDEYLIEQMNKKEKVKNCLTCSDKIKIYSKYCNKCKFISNVINRVGVLPKLSDLLKNINEHGYVKTSKQYNLSDNGLRKWIKSYAKYNIN